MMFPLAHGIAGGHPPLLQVLQSLGLTTNLETVLDAGDAASYTSGQKWLDRSGKGRDFFRGVDGSAASDDPTFEGTAGGLTINERFSHDGADFFTYDSAVEAWMSNIHKNSALYSALGIFFVPTTTGTEISFGSTAAGDNTQVGFLTAVDSTKKPTFFVSNGTGTVFSVTADNALAGNAWHMVGISIDEAAGAGGGFLWADGAYAQVSAADTFDATYTSPSAAGAANTMKIAVRGDGSTIAPNGTLFAAVAMWEGVVLTKTNFDDIHAQMRGRFGI